MPTKLSSSSLVLCVLTMCAVNMAYAAPSSNNAPAPSVDCSNLILTMADCLSYVTNGSTVTTPEGTCCSALKNVLKTAPQCLFEAFKSSARFGVVLNVTKALDLPAACKVSASSVDNCGLTEAPAAPPAAGSLPSESSPTPTSSSAGPGSTGPIGELSPTTAPSPGNAASAFFLIAAGSLLLCLLIAQRIIVWKPSKEKYSTETSSNKLYQRKRLYTLKYSEGKSMQKLIDDFNKMIPDIGAARRKIQFLCSNPSHHMTPNESFSSSDEKQEIPVKLISRRKIQILRSNPSHHMTPNESFSSSYEKQEIPAKLGSRRKIPIEGK